MTKEARLLVASVMHLLYTKKVLKTRKYIFMSDQEGGERVEKEDEKSSIPPMSAERTRIMGNLVKSLQSSNLALQEISY